MVWMRSRERDFSPVLVLGIRDWDASIREIITCANHIFVTRLQFRNPRIDLWRFWRYNNNAIFEPITPYCASSFNLCAAPVELQLAYQIRDVLTARLTARDDNKPVRRCHAKNLPD